MPGGGSIQAHRIDGVNVSANGRAAVRPLLRSGMAGDPSAFELDGDRRGVLCIHGFTGSPYAMRGRGLARARRGPTVHGLALPGHATTVEELEPITWQAWADAVVAAYDRLAARCARVAVVGQSLGGLLALHLSTRR